MSLVSDKERAKREWLVPSLPAELKTERLKLEGFQYKQKEVFPFLSISMDSLNHKAQAAERVFLRSTFNSHPVPRLFHEHLLLALLGTGWATPTDIFMLLSYLIVFIWPRNFKQKSSVLEGWGSAGLHWRPTDLRLGSCCHEEHNLRAADVDFTSDFSCNRLKDFIIQQPLHLLYWKCVQGLNMTRNLFPRYWYFGMD